MTIKFIKPLLFAALALACASCEKVIDVDLNSAAPRTVIEANLKEGDQQFQVLVYQTKDYFSNTPAIYFDDATVTLTDDSGESIALLAAGAGRYIAPVTGVSGKTYTLQVTRNGENFTATSTMPAQTVLNQLSSKELDLPGEENHREVYLHFDDVPGEHNYYRVLVTANDTLELDLQYFDDKYFDGNAVKWSLNEMYDSGDQLSVELRSIDQAAYQFYNTLAPILSGNEDTAPGNPSANWQGGALGYFIAYSASALDGVVE